MSRPLRWTWLCVTSSTLSACALPFYAQAIGGQLELLRKRVPIEDVLQDPARPQELKVKLRTVGEVRRFAAEEMGLPMGDSYTTYADLGRPFVVWNVVAAPELAVEPLRWCFPFAGCVAYRGFFEQEAARRFAERMQSRGMETFVGGARAYSTLGFFADPVLNTMLGAGEQQLVGLLLHELAHQKLYVKGDSELSEAFATLIEEVGTERWLRRNGEREALERYRESVRRRGDFAGLVIAQQARLAQIFAGPLDEAAKRASKAAAYERMRREYQALKQSWGGSSEYDAWFAQPLNNAALAAAATYRRWLPALRWQLEQIGLSAFYVRVEALAALPAEERARELQTWLERALSGPSSDAVATAGAGGGSGAASTAAPRWSSSSP